MNFDKNAQLSSSDSKSFHCNNWAMKRTKESFSSNTRKKQLKYYDIDDDYYSDERPCYREKLYSSYSTPVNNNCYGDDQDSTCYLEVHAKNQFLKEIGQVKQDIDRFRSEMNGLAQQMDGMETDLNHSKDRVHEIEKGLTATQEVNVNLQVLLERAVHKQRESDVYAAQAMRHIHTNLATVVYETGQLKGRLTNIANYQRQHQGSVTTMAERMREYTHMLEQAQGTIQSLQDPSNRIRLLLSSEDDVMNSLDITTASSILSYSTSDEEEEEEEEEPSIKAPSSTNPDLYRHRIIGKRETSPEATTFSSPLLLSSKRKAWLPQKGLRILLNDYHDGF